MPKLIKFRNDDEMYTFLLKRASILGISPSIANKCISDFKKWKSENGKDWVVDRFKNIYTIIIKYLACPDSPPLIDDGGPNSKNKWIKKKNPYVLAGVYGKIQLMLNYESKPKLTKNYLIWLRLYSLLSIEEVSASDVQKQKLTIEHKVSKEAAMNMNPYLNMVSYDNLRRGTIEVVGSARANIFRQDIKVPNNYLFTPPQKQSNEENFWVVLDSVTNRPEFEKLRQKHPILECLPVYDGKPLSSADFAVGTIECIADAAMKRRWVLNAHKPWEHVLHNFGKRLYELAAILPWDITFDEQKCFEPIAEHFKAGKTAYAVDLSQATDRFPWIIQYFLVANLFQDCPNMLQSLDLWDDLLHFASPFLGFKDVGTWLTGQPMGLYPSFAIFTVSHGLLLYALNGYKYNNDFYVHGDDVVILNDSLYTEYLNFLTKCDIPYNPFKTMVSNSVTEINSKLITKDTIFEIPKWKPVTPDNVLDLSRNWGPDIVNLIYKSPEMQEIAKRATRLPFPWGTFEVTTDTPDEEIQERLKGFERIFEDITEVAKLSFVSSFRDIMLSRLSRLPERELNHNQLVLMVSLLDAADELDRQAYLDVPELLPYFQWDVTLARRVLGENLHLRLFYLEQEALKSEYYLLLRQTIPMVDLPMMMARPEDYFENQKTYSELRCVPKKKYNRFSTRLSKIILKYSSMSNETCA